MTRSLFVSIVGNTLTIASGANSVTHTGIYIEHILGASLLNTLDFSHDTVVHNVVLTALGTQHGFQGIADGTLNFDNIDAILAASALNNSLKGMDADATWSLTSATGGRIPSTNTLTFNGFESL